MNEATVLIIDDEPQIRRLLDINLKGQQYQVLQASTGREGIHMAASAQPDLILLDLGLPDISGYEVLKELRQWYRHAILILSVQDKETDIVQALDNGATDYITKPFRTGELMARIRSAIRRNNPETTLPVLISGNLEIDLAARTIKKAGLIVKLTLTEYNLLSLLARNEGRVLTHQHLLRDIWGQSFASETQYLRVYIAQLRKKIEDNPNQPVHIITESGIGYRFL